MITLYSWTTPNGRKISIALEELGLPYEVKPIDLAAQAQFAPAFLAISPNNKIPAIVDHDAPGGPLSIFESGAILIHLAERTGKLLPADPTGRARVLQWLFWQAGGLGPITGQLFYFAMRAPAKNPPAIEHFRDEALRLLGVMERRLGHARYLAGDAYSIADISAYPWLSASMGMIRKLAADSMPPLPETDRWLAELGARPAVQRGMAIPAV